MILEFVLRGEIHVRIAEDFRTPVRSTPARFQKRFERERTKIHHRYAGALFGAPLVTPTTDHLTAHRKSNERTHSFNHSSLVGLFGFCADCSWRSRKASAIDANSAMRVCPISHAKFRPRRQSSDTQKNASNVLPKDAVPVLRAPTSKQFGEVACPLRAQQQQWVISRNEWFDGGSQLGSQGVNSMSTPRESLLMPTVVGSHRDRYRSPCSSGGSSTTHCESNEHSKEATKIGCRQLALVKSEMRTQRIGWVLQKIRNGRVRGYRSARDLQRSSLAAVAEIEASRRGRAVVGMAVVVRGGRWTWRWRGLGGRRWWRAYFRISDRAAEHDALQLRGMFHLGFPEAFGSRCWTRQLQWPCRQTQPCKTRASGTCNAWETATIAGQRGLD